MVPQESFISGYAYNKEKSLLKVNITGKIYAYENTKQIEILYSDTNIYQKEIINNEKNFNLGDLNEKGFILAYSGKVLAAILNGCIFSRGFKYLLPINVWWWNQSIQLWRNRSI